MGEHRDVFLIEEILDAGPEGKVGPAHRNGAGKADVAHEIGGQLSGEREVVAAHGVAPAVVAPFIGEVPFFQNHLADHRGRTFGDVGQLFPDRLVGRRDRIALVDGGCPGEIPRQVPCDARPLPTAVQLRFDAVGVHLADVARREKALGGRQPKNPVVNL